MPKGKRQPHASLEPTVVASTEEVMRGLGVPPEAWDVLVVGDGSGTGWNAACGWAAVLVDRELRLRKDLHGGMNAGTSYLAELFPYVQALSWYVEGPGRARLLDRLAADPAARVRVHVVTDSEIVARQGSGKASRRKGRPYWAMLEALEEAGLETHWHWVARSRLGLNRLCDFMAGACRRSVDAVTAVGPPAGTTVYSFNPDPPAEKKEGA